MPPPRRNPFPDNPPDDEDLGDLWSGEGSSKKSQWSNQRRASSGWQPPRLLTWFLLLLLVGLILTLAYLRDEGPPWENDLRLDPTQTFPVDITAPTRMKAMLQSAANVQIHVTDQPPWLWDTPTLASYLEQHGAVLDNFRDLLEEKEQEWEPRSMLWQVEDLGTSRGWATVCLLKQIEAAYLARGGEEEAAFLAAADMAVMASLLERLSSWPSYFDRAMQLHDASTQSFAVLLAGTALPASVLKRIHEQEYLPWGPNHENLKGALKGFYNLERKLLLGPEHGEAPLPAEYLTARSGWVQFKPQATLHLFADSFRELVDACTPTAFAKTSQLSHRLNQRVSAVKGLGNPNSSGEEYFASRMRRYVGFPERLNLARARHAVVSALFAVRGCVAAESRVPQTLEELVPRYSAHPLLDPFTEEPLKYHPVEGLIYSVGMNLKDDGGKPTIIPLSDVEEPTVTTGIGVARVGQ